MNEIIGNTLSGNVALDSSALIAYFHNEPGGDRVRRVFKKASQGKTKILTSYLHLAETLYVMRRLGHSEQAALAGIELLPIEWVDLTRAHSIVAAELKTVHSGLSLADVFLIAIARAIQGTIVTTDSGFTTVKQSIRIQLVR